MADKHTTGPLRIFTVYAQHEVRTPTDTLVAVVMNRADARLFSAAPELLEALEGMCIALENIGGEHVTGLEGSEKRLRAANAAIAKATGATPMNDITAKLAEALELTP